MKPLDKKMMRQRSQNPPPRNRLGSNGPKSGWRRRFTGIRGGWIAEPTHPDILFEPLCLLFHLAFHFSLLCPLPMVPFRLPDLLLLFFQGLCQLHQASYLWQKVECLWLEVECLETKGLQKGEFLVARSKAKGLYNILHVARTQPEPSTSVDPPPPKKCRLVSTATVSSPRVWSYAHQSRSSTGLHWNKGTLPYLSLNPKKLIYPLRWHPYVST